MDEGYTEAPDHRPTLFAAVRAVAADLDTGTRPVDSITIRLLSSGEVPYRIWFRGEKEPEGGVILPQ